MLREARRVLKDGGCFVAISFASPSDRLSIFENANLYENIEIYPIKNKLDN